MQRHLIPLIFFLVLASSACATVKGAIMSNDNLLVTATCRDNPRCVFTGQDVFIDIRIVNNTGQPITFPLDYLKKRGPTIKLTDHKTRTETFTRPNLVDPAFKEKLTTLAPSDSVTLEWVLTESEISQFDPYHVDVTAEISIESEAQSQGKTVELRGRGTLSIRGANH